MNDLKQYVADAYTDSLKLFNETEKLFSANKEILRNARKCTKMDSIKFYTCVVNHMKTLKATADGSITLGDDALVSFMLKQNNNFINLSNI